MNATERGCLLLGILLFGTTVAYGNGDDFFTYRSQALNADGSRAVTSMGFFGTVKDDAGNYLNDATLTIAVTVDTGDGRQRITYNSYTNVAGHYRTLGPAQVVVDLLQQEVTVNPSDVELLGVEKSGYVQARRMVRSVRNKPGLTEVDFIMKKTN